MLVKNIVDDRKKTGRREEDALQFLIDQGDSLLNIITVSYCPTQSIRVSTDDCSSLWARSLQVSSTAVSMPRTFFAILLQMMNGYVATKLSSCGRS